MSGSLQIKNGKYYIVLSIYENNGKRKQKWIPTGLDEKGNKKAATKMLRDTIKEFEEKSVSLSGYMKFTEYMNEWLNIVKPTVELITWESYSSYIKSHIKPYFDCLNLSLNEVKPQHIQKYINEKHNNGKLNGKGGLSASSIKKHICVIHSIFQEALKNNMIAYNPADRVSLPKQDKYVGNFYSVAEANKLLKAVKGTPIEAAIKLTLYYGLRRSEILGLKWSSIDFYNNNLVIENTIVRQQTVVEKKKTKNKSSHRTLPLFPEMKEFLIKLKREQTKQKLLCGASYIKNDYVCKWADGKPFETNYITSKLHKIQKANNLRQVRLHDLRHSTASLLLSFGISLKEIQEWLGHHDISTTADIYGHLDYEAKKKIADKIGKIIKMS